MNASKDKKIGWKAPVGVEAKTGAIEGTDIESDISQSIVILLNTRPGERLGRPGYGANLMRFTFENVSSALMKEIIEEITTAIKRWENRIENVDVDVLPSEDKYKLIFRISYNIIENGMRSGVLYEFSGNG